MSILQTPELRSVPLKSFKQRLQKRHKTALVLAGGGVTGVVYEVGALQALNQYLSDDFTIHDFDIVVGLSAGSIVGSLLVNGVSPEAMMAGLTGSEGELSAFSKWDVFRPNFGEFFQRAMSLPVTLLNNLWKNVSNYTLGSYPYAQLLDEILPTAIFSNHKVDEYLRTNLRAPGRTNDFRQLNKEFYVVATELDTGDRVLFGDAGHDHVPISKAVQASTAIPLFYRPVRIGRREYIDGAIRKTLSIDIAIEKGAELIVCINPVMPLRNDIERRHIPMLGHRGRYISDKGFPYVWRQMLRLMLHSRVPAGVERYRRFYPNVDILLIEPREDDYKMFFHNIMDYDARASVAEHGFRTVMDQVRDDFGTYEHSFDRHGIKIQPAFERFEGGVVRGFPTLNHDPDPEPSPKSAPTEMSRLKDALNRLEAQIDRLTALQAVEEPVKTRKQG